MVNESNDLSVYIIFQNMEKELRENFEGARYVLWLSR